MENKRQKVNWRLLIAVAKGEARAADLTEFNNWLKESPEQNQLIFEEIKKDYAGDASHSSVNTSDDENEPVDLFTDTATAFSRLMEQEVEKEISETIVEAEPSKTFVISFRYLRATAAAACLIILSGVGLWVLKSGKPFLRTADIASKQQDWQEIKVAFGRQVNLTLDDGSVIRLAPGSRFKYPKAFGAIERRVYLDGEAFFEVSKDSSKPFIVQTERLETRVLGTSFNIEAFKGQAIGKVTVATGKVSVSRNREGGQPELLAFLTPNKQIEFDNSKDSFNVSTLSENIVHAVKNGKLVFDGSTMREIGEALRRRYGVEVHFSDESIAGIRLTTILDYRSIDHLADMLSRAAKLKVTHKSSHLYFDRN